jgi:hypothetical protein
VLHGFAEQKIEREVTLSSRTYFASLLDDLCKEWRMRGAWKSRQVPCRLLLAVPAKRNLACMFFFLQNIFIASWRPGGSIQAAVCAHKGG